MTLKRKRSSLPTEPFPVLFRDDVSIALAEEIAASLPPMTEAEIDRAALLARQLDARRHARASAELHAAFIKDGGLSGSDE
jgi:hypothetical protein